MRKLNKLRAKMKLKFLLLLTIFSSNVFGYNENLIKSIKDIEPQKVQQLLSENQITEDDKDYYLKLAQNVKNIAEYKFNLMYARGILQKNNPEIEKPASIALLSAFFGLPISFLLFFNDSRNHHGLENMGLFLGVVSSYAFITNLVQCIELNQVKMKTYEDILLESCEIIEIIQKAKTEASNNLI